MIGFLLIVMTGVSVGEMVASGDKKVVLAPITIFEADGPREISELDIVIFGPPC